MGAQAHRLAEQYRTGDDYRRYTWENAKRRRQVGAFYRKYRRFFGRSVLDLGCGGGVLAGVLEPTGRDYLGIDANPDMVRAARETGTVRGWRARFIAGDVALARVAAKFDTLTLLGNALGHFDVRDLRTLLKSRAPNVRRGSTLLVEYRDLVAMFFRGSWRRIHVQTFVRGKVVHRTRVVDLGRGRLEIRARPAKGGWVLDWAHAIWSPFVLESLVRGLGWRLVSRAPSPRVRGPGKPPDHYVDVYRFLPNRRAGTA